MQTTRPRMTSRAATRHHVCAGLLVGLLHLAALGPAPSAQTGNATGLTKFIVSVADAEAAAAFYQGAFGLAFANGAMRVPDLQPLPPVVRALTGVARPGATFRATLFALPGAADGLVLEHTEFQGPPRPAGRPGVGDPGAAWFVLEVRDLDTAIANVKRLGGRILTTNEEPVGNNAGSRAVFAADPEGAVIEIIQPADVPPGDALVVGAPRVAFVVEDAAAAGAFYRDVFGLDVRMPGAPNDNPVFAGLPGLPGSTVRSALVTFPGRDIRWQFYEYGAIPRTPYVREVPDPGAPAVGFAVRDVPAALAAITAAGGTVLSEGGVPADRLGYAFARDPSGVLLEVIRAEP
jgi:predicted enzyme related to lactoylglutathione lyase